MVRTQLFIRFSVWLSVALPNIGGLASSVDYTIDIKPLLRSRCYACHGSLKQEAGLRLDTVADIIVGGDSGSAISRNDASDSLILERISADDVDSRMPPQHEGEPLEPHHIDLIRRWIQQGASGPEDERPESDPRDHWAFQPVTRPVVPNFDSSWVSNPIDAFIAQQHLKYGLTPQDSASPLILLRRIYIDLIGLPPSLQEIGNLEANNSSRSYDENVAQLLNDPRHGERWARHWMDVWRYSDWWGLNDQLRRSQKHIWHWRDWIIESLNDDMPYDEMLRLMLAADESHPGDLDKIRATGFLARNFTLFNRPQWMDETVEHVGKGLLGLTMNCARCHDHKFDPIEQDDYYRLRAFFEPYHVRLDVLPGQANLDTDGLPRIFDALPDQPTYRYIRGDEKNPDKSEPIAPGIPKLLEFSEPHIESIDLPPEAWQPERQPWVLDAHIDAAKRLLETSKDKEVAAANLQSVQRRAEAMRASWEANDHHDSKRIEAIQAERNAALVKAKWAAKRAEQTLAQAADDKIAAAQKSLKVAADALDKATENAEAKINPTDNFTSLIGAKWTPTRFKFSGKDDPTVEFIPTSTGRRTALAQWITDRRNPLTARVAVNHIWARHMGRPLVPSMFDFGRNGKPPSHPELLDWLAAELIDNDWNMKHIHRLIVTSSCYQMKSTTAGASKNLAIDSQNRYWWRRVPTRVESQVVRDSILALAGTLDEQIGGPSVPPNQQANSTRRSLYFFHSNNERNQFLTMFDEALVKECYRREQSIVPQQALALANSSLAIDASAKIAKRFVTDNDAEFINDAFKVMLGFKPNDAERAASQLALDQWKGTQERARANLIWALINHNDFITIR